MAVVITVIHSEYAAAFAKAARQGAPHTARPRLTLVLAAGFPRQSWTHSLRQRDKWQLRSLQARISLERKERHDEEIPPQSFCGI
jgi:hypothetical protein